jgi:ribosomal protein S18 acetylase RimI-like enzyme
MDTLNIVTCSDDNKKDFYDLLKHLRMELTFIEFESIYNEAKASTQYELIGVELDNQLVALMGYRILFDFVHGKHLYIDDLVTSTEMRSKGFGAKLLGHAEKIASSLGCRRIRLCTGTDNDRGQSFYLKNGWMLKAVVLKKKLPGIV